MTSPPPSRALPDALRVATVLCVVLAGLVGLWSIWSTGDLAQTEAPTARDLPQFIGLADRQLIVDTAAAQLRALQSIKGPRAFTLAALASVSALVFVAATRMLRPGVLPRESLRQLLVGGTLVLALLRTVDGAELAVVNRVAAQSMRALATTSGHAGDTAASTAGAAATATAGDTTPATATSGGTTTATATSGGTTTASKTSPAPSDGTTPATSTAGGTMPASKASPAHSPSPSAGTRTAAATSTAGGTTTSPSASPAISPSTSGENAAAPATSPTTPGGTAPAPTTAGGTTAAPTTSPTTPGGTAPAPTTAGGTTAAPATAGGTSPATPGASEIGKASPTATASNAEVMANDPQLRTFAERTTQAFFFLQTMAIAGTFAALSAFYSSLRVKQAVAADDARLQQ